MPYRESVWLSVYTNKNHAALTLEGPNRSLVVGLS